MSDRVPGEIHGPRFVAATAVVTGAGSGIGRAVATRLASEGARVIAADIDIESLNSLNPDGIKGTIEPVVVDVRDSESVRSLMDSAGRELDILVCAAGVLAATPVDDFPESDWEKLIAVNLEGVLTCIRESVPLMRDSGGGAIVTISSSLGASLTLPGYVGYAASKGAVAMMSRTLALELAKDEIRVNCVAPGPTLTPMVQEATSEADLQALAAILPVGRLGKPEELAAVIAFLVSDEASFVTGAVVPVDGGQTATLPHFIGSEHND